MSREMMASQCKALRHALSHDRNYELLALCICSQVLTRTLILTDSQLSATAPRFQKSGQAI